jgi:hypothetical protein
MSNAVEWSHEHGTIGTVNGSQCRLIASLPGWRYLLRRMAAKLQAARPPVIRIAPASKRSGGVAVSRAARMQWATPRLPWIIPPSEWDSVARALRAVRWRSAQTSASS